MKVPTRHAGTGERLIPQIFLKPGNETASVMNYIITPMATSSVFKKLEEEAGAGAAGSDQPGKGKGKGKRRRGQKGKIAEGATEAEATFSALVYPMDGASEEHARPKTALDDFMCLFMSVSAKCEKSLGESCKGGQRSMQTYKTSVITLLGHTASCFFEFCFTGSVAINGKFVRNYSSFRTEMSTFIATACEMSVASASQASGSGTGRASQSLSAHISEVLGADPTVLHLGHVKDESDEAKALARIKLGVPIAVRGGMDTFVQDVLQLPLEYHGAFATEI